LRRSTRCSVITQRARMQQRPSSATASVSACAMCGLVLCGPSAGQSRRKNALPYPGREPRGCLHAGGEQRGHLAAPGRRAKWGGDVAKGLSHLILVRSVTGEPHRRLEHKISLHKAASEVRYVVIFNNGSTTGPNGVSELGLAQHRATQCLLLNTLRLKVPAMSCYTGVLAGPTPHRAPVVLTYRH
jgi:hypothetical protein